jgi:hypothetical protein
MSGPANESDGLDDLVEMANGVIEDFPSADEVLATVASLDAAERRSRGSSWPVNSGSTQNPQLRIRSAIRRLSNEAKKPQGPANK